MTTPNDPYYAALRRSVEAKRRMNAAQAELDKAEDEWHQACRALDELEDSGVGQLSPPL